MVGVRMIIDKETTENIQRILKELVNSSIEQWLLGAITDTSKPFYERVLSVDYQLHKLKKEATCKILEMFEIKEG
jgi:hypothetical protein